MPGVPPDAVAQVKKGLKGLFARRHKQRHPEQDAAGAASSSAAAPAASSSGQAGPDTQDPAPHHIAEPPSVAKAKDIDLNPSAPAPEPISSTTATAPAAAAPATAPPTTTPLTTTTLPPSTTTATTSATQPGMSATSGPMGDHMAEDFSLGHEEDTTAAAAGGPVGAAGEGTKAEANAPAVTQAAERGVKEGREIPPGEEEVQEADGHVKGEEGAKF